MLQAADENSVPFLASAITFDAILTAIPFILLLFAGLAKVLEIVTGSGPVDPQALFERFLPPHNRAATSDPFAAVELILGKLTSAGQSLSLVAVPAFIWFSTRLFASIRTALNAIYDVSIRPPKGNFLVRFLLNKLRDLGMVLLTLVFFLANVLLTIGLSLLESYFENRSRPGTDTVVSTLEQWLAYALGYLFLIVLFFFLYRHASLRRVRAPAALVASVFMAFAFEVAKQLYALYLRGATGYGATTLDASIGAMLLFVVWLYYSALVFLLGAVVAETWELRAMQRKQRGIA